MATVGEGAEPQRSDITKAGLAALVASSIEWYDFFIYLTAAALGFPAVFFPESSAVAGVLASFSTAAVGFVARPVGGVLFGHFGDKLGRKPTLVIALVLMGTATVLVGLLPGFATIGVWAPILLFVFRFCQGLALGGQWGGAMLTAVLISSAIQIPALLGFAALTDRVGRRPVYLIGAILLGLWAFPMFWLVNTIGIVLITLALSFGQVFLSMMYGPQAALFAEMFSARVRYSGASLGYQGAAVFAGGLAPIIMVWLLETTGTSLSVSFYILAMAAITFISVYLITDTYEDEMTEDVQARAKPSPGSGAQRPARQSSLSGIEMLGRSIS
jgi:MFS family permease